MRRVTQNSEMDHLCSKIHPTWSDDDTLRNQFESQTQNSNEDDSPLIACSFKMER